MLGPPGRLDASSADPGADEGVVSVGHKLRLVTPMVAPRFGTARDRRRTTLGEHFADTAKEMDLHPYRWQQYMADVSMEMRGNRFRYDNVGGLVPRQSGKTEWAAVRIVTQMRLPDLIGVRPQKIGSTAQSRVSAVRIWEEYVEGILASPFEEQVVKVTHNNGREVLRFANGSEFRPFTPSRTGARGLSLDLTVIDEALAHKVALLGAMRPTQAQRASGLPGVQTILLSSAGDLDSELLDRMTELGRAAVADPKASRCWFEWSADPECNHLDPNVWAATLPTLGEPDGVDVGFLMSEAETLPESVFRREYLNIPERASRIQVIPAEVWADCHRGDVILPTDGIVLGLDVSPERSRAALVAAGLVSSYTPVEVIEGREGMEWVVERCADVSARWNAPVVIDVVSAAASLVPALEALGVDVIPVTTRSVCDAAGMFYDAAMQRRLTHLDDHRLNDGVAGASKRAVGDRWAWDRRRSTVDITPLVAASLALWGVETGQGGAPSVH